MHGPADGGPLLPLLVRTDWLAVPASCVLEIVQLEGVFSFPLAPPWITGLVALRGQVIPLLDLGVFLDLPGAQGVDERLVVVSSGGMTVGLPVARVRGVVLPDFGVWGMSEAITGQLGRFSTGIVGDQDRLLTALDLGAIRRRVIRPAVVFPVGPHRMLVWCDDVLGLELPGDAPCLDLCARFGAPPTRRVRRLRVREPLLDLVIDRVMKILPADLDTRQPVPALVGTAAPVAEIVFVEGQPTYVLDLSRLVGDAP